MILYKTTFESFMTYIEKYEIKVKEIRTNLAPRKIMACCHDHLAKICESGQARPVN